ncbi:hypothetical protein AAG570_008427 [Ranatra chinensis]|uniref:Uncharacterized protein n=1 Tax=Ranatra chinensis TaxID=642074 RepID=A0ABD0YQW0_9HEMI
MFYKKKKKETTEIACSIVGTLFPRWLVGTLMREARQLSALQERKGRYRLTARVRLPNFVRYLVDPRLVTRSREERLSFSCVNASTRVYHNDVPSVKRSVKPSKKTR